MFFNFVRSETSSPVQVRGFRLVRSMKTILTLLAITFASHALAWQQKLSICSIFRDEEPFLLEWIDYHRAMGCERFYLFNDSASPATRSKTAAILLEDYIRDGIVELQYRDECYGYNREDLFLSGKRNHIGFQFRAYQDTCHRLAGQSEWVALLDLDEYVRPMKHPVFTTVLDETATDCGGLFINWICFGTAGKSIERGSSILTQLNRRSDNDDPENKQGKCIVRPEVFDKIHYVHYARLLPAFHYCNGNNQVMVWEGNSLLHPDFAIDNAVLYHYTFRDKAHFDEVKLPRLKKRLNDERIAEWVARFESLEDNSMVEFLQTNHPALFEKMTSNYYADAYQAAVARAALLSTGVVGTDK